MTVTAKLKDLRIAPRKVRLVADLIRGKSVEEAQNILSFAVKKATGPFLKLLKSAIASAKNNFQLEESNLYISKILVDEGRKYKRWRPRARGRADEIQKKTSHITLFLEETSKESRRLPAGQVVKKPKKVSETEKAPKIEKAKFKPEIEAAKPKMEKRMKREFKRKAF